MTVVVDVVDLSAAGVVVEAAANIGSGGSGSGDGGECVGGSGATGGLVAVFPMKSKATVYSLLRLVRTIVVCDS